MGFFALLAIMGKRVWQRESGTVWLFNALLHHSIFEGELSVYGSTVLLLTILLLVAGLAFYTSLYIKLGTCALCRLALQVTFPCFQGSLASSYSAYRTGG